MNTEPTAGIRKKDRAMSTRLSRGDTGPFEDAHNKANKGKGKETATLLPLRPIRVVTMEVPIEEVSPLITHKWSHKMLESIRIKKEGGVKRPREKLDADAEYREAAYLDNKGRHCMPAIAFKKAILTAAAIEREASGARNLSRKYVAGTIFVLGDLIPIEYDKVERREDPVRVGMGSADLRYRPMYTGWRATLVVQFNESLIGAEQVISLINSAGFAVGVGEWRPEKGGGQFGRWQVAAGTKIKASNGHSRQRGN